MKTLLVLVSFLVAMVAAEPDESLINMLESLKSLSKFRRDVDGLFAPIMKNIEDKTKRNDDVNDYLMAMFDYNNDGFLDRNEQFGLFKEMGASSTDQKNILKSIDRNRDYKIDKNELKSVWLYSTYTG